MNTRLVPFGALLLAATPGMLRATPTLTAPVVNTGAELLRVVLSLIGVIVLILVAGWVSRRAQARIRPGGGRRIRIVESLAVGMKEKMLLVDVGGTQILVGASPSGLRTLHVLATPLAEAAVTENAAPPRSFRDILGQWGKPQ